MRNTVTSLALAAALAASPATARTWSQHWTVGAHPSVRVVVEDARVVVRRGAPGVVDAGIEYTIKAWGWHSRPPEPRVAFARAGDSIDVEMHVKGSIVSIGSLQERSRVEVTVPPECDVWIESGDGSVEVDAGAGAGRLAIRTGDGRVTVRGAKGATDISTRDGSVDAEALDGDVRVRTGDGSVRVAGRFDRLTARTGDGRVAITAQPGSRLGGPWSVETGDGGVNLRIPRRLSALLDVTTNDGRIDLRLPFDPGGPHRNTLRGQVNGGTVPLLVRTGDGGIVLALSD